MIIESLKKKWLKGSISEIAEKWYLLYENEDRSIFVLIPQININSVENSETTIFVDHKMLWVIKHITEYEFQTLLN